MDLPSYIDTNATEANRAPVLSGDKAYALFVSPDPFPLHDFLENWKAFGTENPGYVIAVIQAFSSMAAMHDGKRDGTYRPKIK